MSDKNRIVIRCDECNQPMRNLFYDEYGDVIECQNRWCKAYMVKYEAPEIALKLAKKRRVRK